MGFPQTLGGQSLGRAGNRGQLPGMQNMPPNMGNMPSMRGAQGYSQAGPRGGMSSMQGHSGRTGPGNRGQMMGAMGGAMPQDGGSPLARSLGQAPPEAQKQMIGEAIYPKIAALQPDLAGKITGMLLEMDIDELLGL